jgi:hypothetical protein
VYQIGGRRAGRDRERPFSRKLHGGSGQLTTKVNDKLTAREKSEFKSINEGKAPTIWRQIRFDRIKFFYNFFLKNFRQIGNSASDENKYFKSMEATQDALRDH